MFVEHVRRLRVSLQALFTAGRPLDHATFQYLLLSLFALEAAAIEHAADSAPTPSAPPADNVIPFRSRPLS